MDPRTTDTTRPHQRARQGALLLCALFAGALTASPAAAAAAGPAGTAGARSARAWGHETGPAARATPGRQALVTPRHYAAFTLDPQALEDVLRDAPRAATAAARTAPLVVSVPAPDGTLQRFAVSENEVMAPALAAAHPEIRTYGGVGVDDPTATVRLDLTPLGFHAAVRSRRGSSFVDPRYRDQTQYVAYARDAVTSDPAAPFMELSGTGTPVDPAPGARAGAAAGSAVRQRTYRLALLSDPSYATAVGGAVTAAKATLVNRVDQLYESDFAIHLQLVAGNDALNLDTAARATGPASCGTGPCFTTELAGCDSALLSRMGLVVGRLLGGAGGYDIGHVVLGKDRGGIANVGVVGRSGKAGGCTGLPNPLGDAFAVDYVAHEMGHQFGGDHTFDGTQSNCSGANRATGLTTVEPGSGTTVMAYAGICGTDDLQAHSDPYFSQASITQMSAYVTGAETTTSSRQQATFAGFGAGDTYALTYNRRTSSTLTGSSSSATVKSAIEALGTGTVSVGAITSTGFTVTFAATGAVLPLTLVNPSGFTGFVAEIISGGPTTAGGSTVTTTANHVPAVSTAAAYTVPVRTPFTLTATGSDVDGDALTYLWEQNDPGSALAGTGLVDNAKADGPLFRVFGTAARYPDADAHLDGVASPGENRAGPSTSRTFPDLPQVLAGNTDAATGSCPAATAPVSDAVVDCYSEYLPTPAWVGTGDRVMHFRVSARDGAPGAGGVGSADTALTLAPTAGPFRVTSQATPQTTSSDAPLALTWDVARTDLAPVGAANVKVLYSTDGGLTFPYVLAASTPNDGTEAVSLPAVATTQGRIIVQAVGNVFFDASRADLTVTVPAAGSTPATTTDTTPPSTPPADTTTTTTADKSPTATDPATTPTPPADATTTADTSPTPTDPAPTSTDTSSTAPSPSTATVVPSAATTARRAASLAAAALGGPAVLLGTLGDVRLFWHSSSLALGRPRPVRRLAVAVCLSAPCRVATTAQLITVDRRRRTHRQAVVFRTLRVATQSAAPLTLRLSAARRGAVKAARRASLRVTVRVGTRTLTRTYRFTTG